VQTLNSLHRKLPQGKASERIRKYPRKKQDVNDTGVAAVRQELQSTAAKFLASANSSNQQVLAKKQNRGEAQNR